MKKLLAVIIALFACMLISSAAIATAESIYAKTLDSIKDSVLHVSTSDYIKLNAPPFSVNVLRGRGTGFVVRQTEKKTVVVTAKHVTNLKVQGTRKHSVEFKGKKYTAVITEQADSMDAAYLVFMPAIPGVKAFKFNLSPSNKVTECLAIGFGQSCHIKGQKQTATLTHGYVSRKVCPTRVFGGDNRLFNNVIYGTPTVIFGYSGGPLVDLDLKLLGINVAIMGQTNVFVDIRAVYNWMRPTLSKIDMVKVPYNKSFEIFNMPGVSRLAIDDETTATYESEHGKLPFANLRKLLTKEALKPVKTVGPFIMKGQISENLKNWIHFETIITIAGKHYKVREVTIDVTPVNIYRYSNPFAEKNNLYIYMCDKGWDISIFIVEITKDKVEFQRKLIKEKIDRRKEKEKDEAEKKKAKAKKDADTKKLKK